MKYIFFLLVSMGLFFRGLAANDSLPQQVKHYTDADGLPQNSIKSIAAGRDGFIWLTTEGGLVRFDGKNFLNISSRHPQLHSGRFSHFIPDPESPSFLALNDQGELLRIGNGYATIDSSFSRAQREALDFIPGLRAFDKQAILPQHLRGFISYNDTGIIRYTDDKVFVWDSASVCFFQSKKQVYRIPFSRPEHERFFMVKGELHYLNPDATISRFGAAGITRVAIHGALQTALTAKHALSGIKLYWNTSEPGGALLYYQHSFFTLVPAADGSFYTMRVVDHFDAERNQIISAWQDKRTGDVLLGSHVNGLYVVSRPIFTTVSPGVTGMDNVYYAQVLLGDSSILTGQGHLYHPDNPQVHVVVDSAAAISDKYGMVIDRKGFIWIKGSRKLSRLDPKTFQVLAQWSMGYNISSIYESRDGWLWLGFDNGELWQMNLAVANPKPVYVKTLPAGITYLQEDDSFFWIATSSGLYRFYTGNNKAEVIRGLENKHVRSVYITSFGRLWITTYGNGFYLYDKQKLTAFPTDIHHYLLMAHCIIEDKKGFFWISTNKGLFQVAKNDLLAYAKDSSKAVYYQYYSKSDGLATNEFNGGCQPCGVKLENGWVSLPSINGLVWFNPDKLRTILPDGDLFIDKLLVDNKEMRVAEELNLPRSLQQLRLFISTPYPGNPENIHISYALVKKGGEPVWLTVEDNQVITLSTLPSGNYELRIRKMNGFGPDNYTEKLIRIRVQPPWILQPRVLLAAAGLLILLTLLFIRARTRYIHRKNLLLQKMVEQKTAALQQALDELEVSQQELVQQTELQQKMLAVFSHDIKAPMKYLMITAEKIYQGLKQEGNTVYTGPSRIVNEHIRRVYYVMENILQYIKTQITESRVTEEPVDVYELVKEKLMIYEDIAGQSQSLLQSKVVPGFSIKSNKVLLSVVLHNLLDNAVKVTEKGRITIDAVKDNGIARISITDTGIGISQALLDWINFTGDKQQQLANGYKHTGIGLVIVKDLSALLGFTVKAESTAGSTTILLEKKEATS